MALSLAIWRKYKIGLETIENSVQMQAEIYRFGQKLHPEYQVEERYFYFRAV